MKSIKKDYFLLFFLLFFSIGKAQEPPSSEEYNYNTFEAQKKWIVGTFLDDEDHNTELTFTKDGRCIWKYLITGDSTDHYTYTIEYSTRKAETPSGYVDDNVYTLYLKSVPADPNEDLTYEIAVSDTGLALYPWPMGIGGQFVLSRVKTKESLSSKFPFFELGPLKKFQTAEEAYNAGYNDCKQGNAYGTSLRNKQYEMDYDYGWDKAGCPVR